MTKKSRMLWQLKEEGVQIRNDSEAFAAKHPEIVAIETKEQYDALSEAGKDLHRQMTSRLLLKVAVDLEIWCVNLQESTKHLSP